MYELLEVHLIYKMFTHVYTGVNQVKLSQPHPFMWKLKALKSAW